MKSFRVETITEKMLIRINRFLPRPIKKEWVPDCFGEPDLDAGYCNRFKPVPEPTPEIPKPVLCACYRSCLITLAEQLGMTNVEVVEESESQTLTELCISELGALANAEAVTAPATPEAPAQEVPADAPPPAQEQSPVPAEPKETPPLPPVEAPPEPVETPPLPVEQPKQPPQAPPASPETSSEPGPATDSGPPAEAPQPPPAPSKPMRTVEFQCEKCLTLFPVNPQTFDGIMRCIAHREDTGPAPVSGPVPQDPPVVPAAIDNPPGEETAAPSPPESPQFVEIRCEKCPTTLRMPVETFDGVMLCETHRKETVKPQSIPFRRSSAAWKVWGMLLEPLTADELDAKMRAGNYKYLKKQLPAVLKKAMELNYFVESGGKLHIIGNWDTEPGAKAKKKATKKGGKGV